MRLIKLFFCIFLPVLITGCTDQETLFSQLDADRTGIDFVNKNHETELSNILSYEYFYNGGGVALGDINNDGLVDIYFTSNIFENKLYLNQGNLKFKDITKESGTACEVGWKTGVTMADINGDGLLDIYVCRSASPNPERRKNILLINKGNLTFEDQAEKYNLDDASYSTQAAFFDFDRDGDLDMILLNHSLLEISNSFSISVKNSNVRFPEVGNKLYLNDNGYYRDISDSVGVFGSAFNYGLGMSLSDINNDGWIDIYAGCDYTGRDRLLLNDQGKYFRDVTHDQLSHISKFTMGTDIADINGDDQMDILTLDMLPEDNFRQKQLMGSDPYDAHLIMVKNGLHAQYMRNMLHVNNGNGTFSEIGQLAGISNTDWSWGALIQDYDNDGIQDIFISNGFKRDLTNNDFAKFKAAQEINEAKLKGKSISTLDVISKMDENRISNYSFKGNGDFTFTNSTSAWGLEKPLITHGIAYADLDNDGDLDLVTNNMNDEASIYRNNSEKLKNNFVSIHLVGVKNTFAVGARVSVYIEDKKMTLEQLPVRGFQSTVDNTLHFGLGSAASIDSLVVVWPGGKKSVIKSPRINTTVVVKENDLITTNQPSPIATLFSEPDTIDFAFQENSFIDFNTQALLPRMYSTQGPALAVGDVNKDGFNDIYVGGPKGKSGKLFIQNKTGQFIESKQKEFLVSLNSEDIDATFFDMDLDGDLDLYVVTGGYEFQLDDDGLKDQLYENDGRGNFTVKNLPPLKQSGSCVRVADIDNDNDLDLFIGGRIVPGRYPEIPFSYILINDGKGNFSSDNNFSKVVKEIGMVTDATWIDLNKDQLPDLVVVGEWMSVKVFINEAKELSDQSSSFFNEPTQGFWNCIIAEDFDNDGDKDLVIGNLGLNSQMRASQLHPVKMFYSDYDNNGSVDPILEYWVKDKSYPYPTRDELMQQVPTFKKKFTDYKSYSMATISDVLTPEELRRSQKAEVTTLESCYFKNIDNHFEMMPLPVNFQFAPIFALAAADFNNDGKLDILSGGNLTATRARTGKLTGNYGMMAYGSGDGNFSPRSYSESGLKLKGDVRHMIYTKGVLLVAVNNGGIIKYKINNK
jgi:enediyne biosynthesis protein E4